MLTDKQTAAHAAMGEVDLEGLTCYFEGEYVPMAEARVSILTHAFLYGTAVFEGIRAYWNPDEGLQSMWVDLDGRCLVLSFHPIDENSQAVAEQVAAIAVGNL